MFSLASPVAENPVVCGPSGTGKTHFLEALGQGAIDAGHHVSWFSLEALGGIVHRHRADDSITRAIKRIMRAELIVIDDLGLLPVATETAEALYRVVGAAYERRSLAISSNLHPSGFDELMPKTGQISLTSDTGFWTRAFRRPSSTPGRSIRTSSASTSTTSTPLCPTTRLPTG